MDGQVNPLVLVSNFILYYASFWTRHMEVYFNLFFLLLLQKLDGIIDLTSLVMFFHVFKGDNLPPKSIFFFLEEMPLFWKWVKKKKNLVRFTKLCACMLSHVRLSTTLWAVALQAPLSLGFSRQKYCSGLPILCHYRASGTAEFVWDWGLCAFILLSIFKFSVSCSWFLVPFNTSCESEE